MIQSKILDHPIIGARYFFPRPGNLPKTTWVQNGPVNLACYHHEVSEGAKTVVYFHGNGEIVSDFFHDFLPDLTSLGVNSFFAEYRGYGESSGEPALVAMLEDAEKVVESLNIPVEQMVFFGRSLGSLYAIHLASKYRKAAGLIIESGVANPLERILLRASPQELGCTMPALEEAVRKWLNQKEKLSHVICPSLFMHTQHDNLVNVQHAKDFFTWANEPKQLKIFPSGDHNSIFFVNRSAYLAELASFFKTINQ